LFEQYPSLLFVKTIAFLFLAFARTMTTSASMTELLLDLHHLHGADSYDLNDDPICWSSCSDDDVNDTNNAVKQEGYRRHDKLTQATPSSLSQSQRTIRSSSFPSPFRRRRHYVPDMPKSTVNINTTARSNASVPGIISSKSLYAGIMLCHSQPQPKESSTTNTTVQDDMVENLILMVQTWDSMENSTNANDEHDSTTKNMIDSNYYHDGTSSRIQQQLSPPKPRTTYLFRSDSESSDWENYQYRCYEHDEHNTLFSLPSQLLYPQRYYQQQQHSCRHSRISDILLGPDNRNVNSIEITTYNTVTTTNNTDTITTSTRNTNLTKEKNHTTSCRIQSFRSLLVRDL
jgi:hypothetical protein